MSAELEGLERLERVLSEALCAADPVAALKAARADDDLPQSIRAQLAAASDDGFRIASLLVVRLRFERVMQGSTRAGAWFERDPEDFARAFRRYHTTQPPRLLMPSEEGAAFDAWAATNPPSAG